MDNPTNNVYNIELLASAIIDQALKDYKRMYRKKLNTDCQHNVIEEFYKSVYRNKLVATCQHEIAEGYFYSKDFDTLISSIGLEFDVDKNLERIRKEVDENFDEERCVERFKKKHNF